MKKNETVTIIKDKPLELRKWFDYLEYDGIDGGMLSFFYKDCKIKIPLDSKCIRINRYQFEVEEATQDLVTLKYLGLRKKDRSKSL